MNVTSEGSPHRELRSETKSLEETRGFLVVFGFLTRVTLALTLEVWWF